MAKRPDSANTAASHGLSALPTRKPPNRHQCRCGKPVRVFRRPVKAERPSENALDMFNCLNNKGKI
ncbi:hypothetical protein [Kingella potus]|uniref:hypothetical protein n=1 Tax=Kingella potus TaxID=265175 RepID=UPI001FCFD4F1|nr:hypothetical protein [Kingella potus]UOP00503.1 hypothetical protein LVJ84_11735 [Kingella potus]